MSCLTIERKTHYLCQLDYVKLVMAFLVVACHTHPLYPLDNENFIFRALREFADIAVPFFFMTSAFVLFGAQNKGEKSTLNLYIKRIVISYCIWSLIYLPLGFYGYFQNGASPAGAMISYVRNFLFVGSNFCSYQLWYLLSTIWGALLLLLLQKCTKSNTVTGVIAGLVFVLAQIIDAVLDGNNFGFAFMPQVRSILAATINDGRILLGFVYLCAGKILATQTKILSRWLTVPAFLVLYALAAITQNEFISLMMHISFFEAVLSFAVKGSKDTARMARKLSTCIYYLHMLVVFVLYCICGAAFYYGWQMFVVVAVATTLIGIGLMACGRRRPKWFTILFG